MKLQLLLFLMPLLVIGSLFIILGPANAQLETFESFEEFKNQTSQDVTQFLDKKRDLCILLKDFGVFEDFQLKQLISPNFVDECGFFLKLK